MASASAEKERERERERETVYGHGFAKTASGRRLLRGRLIGVEFSSEEIDICVMNFRFRFCFFFCISVFPRELTTRSKSRSSNFKFHLLDELSDDCSNSWLGEFARDELVMHTVYFLPPQDVHCDAYDSRQTPVRVDVEGVGEHELHITMASKEASNDF